MTTEHTPETAQNRPEDGSPPVADPGPAGSWGDPSDDPDDQRDEEEGYGHGV